MFSGVLMGVKGKILLAIKCLPDVGGLMPRAILGCIFN